jgi:predicted ester cyclase
MEKTTVKILIMGLILGVLIISLILVVSAKKEKSAELGNNYTWTKAVCDSSNFCQDYIIECKNKNMISMIPITGSATRFSDNWHDPRSQERINELC